MRYKAFVEMTDEGEGAELDERTDAVSDEADDAYDESEDGFDEAEDPQGDEEDDEAQDDDEELDARPRTRTVRRRAPARPDQKARHRR
jgi:hypothetical protein